MPNKITQYAQRFVLEGRLLPWRWSEDLSCVEWSDGSTLCFREELEEVLDALATDDWMPELQDTICILAALKSRTDKQMDDLRHFVIMKKEYHGEALPKSISLQIYYFLKLLGQLPDELKQRQNRLALFRLLFSSPDGQSGQKQKMGPVTAFRQGALDQVIHKLEREGYETAPSNPIMYMVLSEHYKSLPQLEDAIRTKLRTLPPPAELELPPPTAEDLLTTLSQDEKTAGLANVARQLVAIMNLPNASRAASDLPLGGIADMTNRGDLSKLLLSELANDDDTLTARLVNNEALFYEQEAPPVRPPAKRVVLIDNTIRLWGTPRIVSLCAALSLGQQAPDTTYYTLSGRAYREIELKDKEEVIEAVGSLATELDCRMAIQNFLQEVPLRADMELVFISEAGWIYRSDMQSLLALLRQKLKYWVAVDRSGKVEVHRFVKGQRRLLLHGQVDTTPLLPEVPQTDSRTEQEPSTPKYLQKGKTPLYWPCENNRMAANRVFAFSEHVFLTLDKYGRLLLWPKPKRGAVELAVQVPEGKYFLHKYSRNAFSFLIYQSASNSVVCYRYTFAGRELEVEKLQTGHPIEQVRYYSQNKVILFYNNKWHTLEGDDLPALRSSKEPQKDYLQRAYKRINSRCCTLRRIEAVSLDPPLGIVLNNDKALKADRQNDRLFFDERRTHTKPRYPATAIATVPSYAKDTGLPARSFAWPDGSVAYADRRGKLFLRSSNPSLPEIAIITVANHPTAAWSSDGYACGQPFYTGRMEVGRTMKAQAFYDKYIDPFIQQILSYEKA